MKITLKVESLKKISGSGPHRILKRRAKKNFVLRANSQKHRLFQCGGQKIYDLNFWHLPWKNPVSTPACLCWSIPCCRSNFSEVLASCSRKSFLKEHFAQTLTPGYMTIPARRSIYLFVVQCDAVRSEHFSRKCVFTTSLESICCGKVDKNE